MQHETVLAGNSRLLMGQFPRHLDIADDIEEYIATNGQKRHPQSRALMTEWFTTAPAFNEVNAWVLSLIQNDDDASSRWRKHHGFKVYNCWGNLYRKGSFVDAHDHLPYYLSYVYFAKACDRAAPLIFTHSKFAVKPRGGLVVVFPSHLSHHVPVHTSDSARVTISGNIFSKEEYLYKDKLVPVGGMAAQS